MKEILKLHPNIWLSVSATTRRPRDGEIDGQSYFFLSDKRFKELLDSGGFLEWAEFAGNSYGTPRAAVEERLAKGSPVLLEIELEGARQVRNSFPEAFQIFLAPPNFDELERRIRGRATDSESAIKTRLIRAKEEILAQNEFDAVLVNDELQVAITKLQNLMQLS